MVSCSAFEFSPMVCIFVYSFPSSWRTTPSLHDALSRLYLAIFCFPCHTSFPNYISIGHSFHFCVGRKNTTRQIALTPKQRVNTCTEKHWRKVLLSEILTQISYNFIRRIVINSGVLEKKMDTLSLGMSAINKDQKNEGRVQSIEGWEGCEGFKTGKMEACLFLGPLAAQGEGWLYQKLSERLPFAWSQLLAAPR